MNTENKIKYVVYARKSSESEDRQVQSIDDQINKLKEIAKDFNLQVVKVFKESKSAKQPNNRPLFSELISLIESGNANGILCWQINRLSRNPVDSATIQWMLQEGKIQSIKTVEREYRSDDNQLLFSVESGMANQFILDLRKATIRGLVGKLERGGYISKAPLGYKNDIINKTIVRDPERFDLIRKLWDMVLNEKYKVTDILEIINNQLYFRTPIKKKSGGKPLSQSGLYRILSNKAYAGIVSYKDKEYQGTHEPMINLDEYERVQEILGKKNKSKPHKYEFAFTGIIKCGHCGCLVTAEEKTKHIKATNKNNYYTYYRCTRRKKGIDCKEKPVTLQDLEKQILTNIEKYMIPKEFTRWALDVLQEKHKKEVEFRSKDYERLDKQYISLQKQLDNLTKMRLKDLITDTEYEAQRAELLNEIKIMKNKLSLTQDRAINWVELMEKAFNFVTTAREVFLKGNVNDKRQIFSALGQNYILKDGKLLIKPAKWLVPISNQRENIIKDFRGLELICLSLYKGKNRAIDPVLTKWGGYWESNPDQWYHKPLC